LASTNNPLDLLPHQKKAVRKWNKRRGFGLFMDMGTGKTRVALEILRRKKPKRVLVVAPLSAIPVWAKEVRKVGLNRRVRDASLGTIRERADYVKARGNCILTVGYESYWREPLRSAILKWGPNAVVYDEAHRLKSAGAKQSRFAGVLYKELSLILALTGTPMPNGPEDLYALYRAFDQEVFGTRLMDFERRYIKKGGWNLWQIVGYNNLDEIEEKVKATSYRTTKEEVLDLEIPDDIDVTVRLAERTRKIYAKLKKEAIAEVEGIFKGKRKQGVTLSRAVITNILRLQQITSGFAKLSTGEIVDLSKEKLHATRDLVQDSGASHVVIFCRFRRDIDRLRTTLTKDVRVRVLDGRAKPAVREMIRQEFERTGGVLIAQVAVASLGIDLSFAHTAIFYSPDYSLTNYLQSRDRLQRIGQEQKVTYYHLIAEHTIDQRIYDILARKEDLTRQVLDVARIRHLFGN
jgi:SNF2 family DNA or RNA helicase